MKKLKLAGWVLLAFGAFVGEGLLDLTMKDFFKGKIRSVRNETVSKGDEA